MGGGGALWVKKLIFCFRDKPPPPKQNNNQKNPNTPPLPKKKKNKKKTTNEQNLSFVSMYHKKSFLSLIINRIIQEWVNHLLFIQRQIWLAIISKSKPTKSLLLYRLWFNYQDGWLMPKILNLKLLCYVCALYMSEGTCSLSNIHVGNVWQLWVTSASAFYREIVMQLALSYLNR